MARVMVEMVYKEKSKIYIVDNGCEFGTHITKDGLIRVLGEESMENARLNKYGELDLDEGTYEIYKYGSEELGDNRNGIIESIKESKIAFDGEEYSISNKAGVIEGKFGSEVIGETDFEGKFIIKYIESNYLGVGLGTILYKLMENHIKSNLGVKEVQAVAMGPTSKLFWEAMGFEMAKREGSVWHVGEVGIMIKSLV